MMYQDQIARNIRILREMFNYTQEHVADKLNMSQNAYSMLETGETRMTVDRLGQLAELYQVDMADILRMNEQTIIHNVTNNGGSCSHSQQINIHNSLDEEERKFYQDRIIKLEQQIERLTEMIASDRKKSA